LELRANRFFADFSEKEIAELLKMSTMLVFRPGEHVVREREISQDVYIILSGGIRIEKTLYAGDEKEFALLEPGEFFGEMAFLDGGPRSANVVCVEESTMLRIDRDSFEKVATERPAIAYKMTMKIARALAERLRASNDVVEGLFSNPNKAILEFKTRLMKIQTMLRR
jgi:CRP-like cAMP-binding protein